MMLYFDIVIFIWFTNKLDEKLTKIAQVFSDKFDSKNMQRIMC